MNQEWLQFLVDPVHRQPLQLKQGEYNGADIVSGILEAVDGTQYSIRSHIPRFVVTDDQAQLQTSNAFGYKWGRRDTYDSTAMRSLAVDWMSKKYGASSLAEWVGFYSSRRRILDLGCGSGFTASLWLESGYWPAQPTWVGVDISSAIDVAYERLKHIPNTHFFQADALQLPFADASFDLVFSEGVLHHTPSTRNAFLSAARLLEPGGEFHFYVYRRKGPVREFADDDIRRAIAEMSDDEAWESMRTLTRLGKALSDLHAEVEVDDVPLLGIKAGRYDVQRLLYWHFAKLYWNERLSFEENVHVNFDWYRPTYAHRHTEQEIRQWCADAHFSIKWFHKQESGFTVVAFREG